MTYLQFLITFLLPPIVLLGIYFRYSSFGPKKHFLQAIGLLCLLAFTYTTPWDNYLVATDVWGYGESKVMGTIGYVPIEEYCFFFLQTIMTGLWCFFVSAKNGFATCNLGNSRPKAIIFVFILAEALSLMAFFNQKTRYMGLILSWALPIVFLQLWFGLDAILKNIRLFILVTAPPTLYLWVADAYAIGAGIWHISELQTVGFEPFGLPVEEAIFFLMTNLMVGQGMMLFVGAREDALKTLRLALPGNKTRKEKA